MTPLERAAEQVAKGDGHWPWASLQPDYKEECRATARAVLLAVREPSNAVITAMNAEDYPDSGSYTRWQAGIDAILEGGE